MTKPDLVKSPEALLSHSGFVQAIAWQLLHDEHRAEDATQDTWVAALRHPPERGSLPEWLATVVKNFARMGLREDKRRSKREQATARSEAVRSTSDIVEQESTRRNVVDAVLSLSEPNRSAILFRFYDDLPPREIARVCGVPVETVKTRIQRGLLQMKKQLDSRYGGDRKSWCLAMVPLTGLKFAGTQVTASSAATTMGTGATLASVMMKFLCSIMLVLGLICGYWALQSEDKGGESRLPSMLGGGLALSGSGPSSSPSADGDPCLEKEAIKENKQDKKEESLVLAGAVTDRITGDPVTAYDFTLIGPEGGDSRKERIHRTVHHDQGCFSFPIEEGGNYQIVIRSSKYRLGDFSRLKVSGTQGLTDLALSLERGHQVRGRVIDGETNRPVEGVLVGADTLPYIFRAQCNRGFGEILDQGFDEFEPHAFTDAAGAFRLSGLDGTEAKISAILEGYAQSWVPFKPGETQEVLIRLKKGWRITGKAFTDEGLPLAGLPIFMQGDAVPLARTFFTGEDGSFRTDPVLPGKVCLWIDPERAPSGTTGLTPEVRMVKVIDRNVEVNFSCLSPDYVTWRGTLFDWDGFPITSGELWLGPEKGGPSCYPRMMGIDTSRTVKVDSEGCFEIKKLVMGCYLVDVHVEGKPFRQEIEWGSISLDRPGLFEKDLCLSGGSLRGTVIGTEGWPMAGLRGRVTARTANSERDSLFTCYLDEKGDFYLPGLPAGIYSVEVSLKNSCLIHGGVDGIQLEENQRIENLKLQLPCQGSLQITFAGFDFAFFQELQLTLSKGRDGIFLKGAELVYDATTMEGVFTCRLETGQWLLSCKRSVGDEARFIEQKLAIRPDEPCTLRIEEDHPWLTCEEVLLSGYLTLPDGSPLDGGEITATPRLGSDGKEGPEDFQTTIGEDGFFLMDGLQPGRWDISLRFENGYRMNWPGRKISADRSHELDLDLDRGSIAGLFLDSSTNKAVPIKGSEGKVYLYDRKLLFKYDPIIGYYGNPFMDITPRCEALLDHGRFLMEYVPDGNYFLFAQFPGFETYMKEFISVDHGEAVEVDPIRLDPCGRLLLDLSLGNGEPPRHFSIVVNKVEHFSHDYWDQTIRKKSPTLFQLDKLPLGLVEITVQKDGFRPQTFEIRLEPGQVKQHWIVLNPQ